jgi:hypothetical protein
MTIDREQTNRDRAEAFEEGVVKPLQAARDHCHWLSINRHEPVFMLEPVVEAALRIAYIVKGRLVRGER